MGVMFLVILSLAMGAMLLVIGGIIYYAKRSIDRKIYNFEQLKREEMEKSNRR